MCVSMYMSSACGLVSLYARCLMPVRWLLITMCKISPAVCVAHINPCFTLLFPSKLLCLLHVSLQHSTSILPCMRRQWRNVQKSELMDSKLKCSFVEDESQQSVAENLQSPPPPYSQVRETMQYTCVTFCHCTHTSVLCQCTAKCFC